ncbi:MAG: EscU/YscU/HrcU family type III secretion system export apparatus switch protein, partial [Brevundimonas sp.]|nr:EscU/YscU/HrcU family type III secretion system export apparatus switch protein [Brevundimonas sp.]
MSWREGLVAEGADPESKTEEATPRKLEEARKKGDVAKSADVGQVMALTGAAAVILGGGDGTLNGAAPALMETGLPFGILPLGTANSFARTLGLQGLLDWLQMRIARADPGDEAQLLRLESDALRVQIVTLHKSKGLE